MATESLSPSSDCPGGNAGDRPGQLSPAALGQIAGLEARIAHLEAENEQLRHASSRDTLALVQAYLAQLSMPAWLATEQGVITYANPAYDRALMVPGISAVGRCLDDLYAPEYAQEYHSNNAEVLATNAEVDVLEEALLADGTVGTFLVRKFPVAMGNQRWVGAIAVNITDLKRTEVSLQELVSRWQLAVESAADGVWEWNLASDEVVMSPQWQAMLGYDEGEISPTVDVWMDRIHPDDMDGVRRALEPHLQGKTPLYQCEHRLRHRDGYYVWVLDRGKVIERDSHGQPQRMIGTHTDISDRKRAEAEREAMASQLQAQEAFLRSIYDGTELCIFVIDVTAAEEFCFAACNSAYERIVGYSEADLVGKTPTEANFPIAEAITANYRRCRDRRTTLSYEEAAVVQGRQTHWFTTLTPIVQDGIVTRIIGTCLDITHLKQVEQQLRQSQVTNQAILEAMPDLLLRVRRDGTCYDVIPPRHEEAGLFLPVVHHIGEVLPPDLVDQQILLIRQAIDTQTLQVVEHAFVKGRILAYEEVRIAPCDDDECLVVVRDITDRKTAELALRQSEARFMAISDASPANIYILAQRPDGSLCFEHMSRSVETIHDVSVEAVLADATILIDHIHPDDRAAYDAAVEHSANTLDPFSHQWRIITPSGQLKWLEGRSQPLRRPNGDTAWYGVAIDITNLKRIEDDRQQTALDLQQSLDQLMATQLALKTSETQLSGILNSSLNGVIAFRARRDPTGTIVDFEGVLVNPAACKLLHRPAARLVGGSMLEELPGNLDSGLFDQYVQVVETGRPLQRELYYAYDQIEGWYEVVAVKQGDGIAVTFHNITSTKQSELALQQLNQQLEQQVELLHQRNTDMQLLGSLSDALQACQTTEEAYGVLAELLQPMFPHCGGGLLIMPPASDDSSPPLEVAARWGITTDLVLSFAPSACLALQQGCSLWIDADHAPERCCRLSHLGADQTTFCVPISGQGTLLGLLYLHSADPLALNPAKGQLAQTVADQIALALANLNLRATLRHQSIRDPLTELYNRRYLEASLTQEIVAAQRKAYPIGVVMLDLDRFKMFNDTYGHAAGDRALQAIARLLQDSVRGSDIACRYGGEEITLILPGSGSEETWARAEELREAIAALTWPDQPAAVTASLGVACFPQHGATPDALLQAADGALYRAKQEGRDRVAMA